MSVFLLVFCIICFAGVKFAKPGEFHRDYMSREAMLPVKGIFVILVFFKHFLSYYTLKGTYDGYANWYAKHIGQTIVTMFLLYSGYGVMESIKKRGRDYVLRLPVKVLKLWLHFALAVFLFLIFRLLTGKRYEAVTIIKTFLGINSIGNSNWYIVAMLIMYLLTFAAFIAFQFGKKQFKYLPAVILTLFVIGYILIARQIVSDYTWYNTIICYPMGIWFSLLRERIEKILFKNDILWWLALLLAIIPFCWTYAYRSTRKWYLVCMVCFTVIALLLTMKVRFGNALLEFFGAHVFSIYILQRLPMNILRHMKLMKTYPAPCFVISLIATVVLALAFDYVTEKMDQRLFRRAKVTGTQSS